MIKKTTLLGLATSTLFLFINGCTIPIQATKIGENQYTLSNPYRSLLYSNATKFCSEKNLSLKPTRERTVQGMLALDFKCLSSDSKSYKDNTIYEAPDNVTINPK